jgi:glycine hydroxymethyltransferase
LRPELTGREAEDRLGEIGITVNRNAIPFDPRPPMQASGLRIGTAALVTRGLGGDDFLEIGAIIGAALGESFPARAGELAERVHAIVERYPLYEWLASATPA